MQHVTTLASSEVLIPNGQPEEFAEYESTGQSSRRPRQKEINTLRYSDI